MAFRHVFSPLETYIHLKIISCIKYNVIFICLYYLQNYSRSSQHSPTCFDSHLTTPASHSTVPRAKNIDSTSPFTPHSPRIH